MQNSPPPSDAKPMATHTMIRSAFVVGAMTILSRLLGLWRFRLLGGIFGATAVSDAFNFAFFFPNLTRRLFGEGLLTSAFVPVFSDRLARNQHDAANRTASVLLFRLTYWLSFGTVVLIALSAAARTILPKFIGLDPGVILELKLLEFMLPYCIFINVAAVLMAILNSLGHFWMPAFAPVLLNVFMISACYWALPYFGQLPQEQIWAVAVAVLIGGACQLLIQIPSAIMRGFRFVPRAGHQDDGYREVMQNFKPVLLMVVIFQLNVLMDNIIAKHLIAGDGPVTYLNMGTSVYQLPWAIFSLALGTAALPALSQLWAQSRKAEYNSTLVSALRLVVYLAIPCTVGIMLLSQDIVRLLYGSGRFLENDAEPVRRTGYVVMFSSLGLLFFSVNSILARALYAMKDMKTPTRTTFHSVLINFSLNIFFVLLAPAIAWALEPFLYANLSPGLYRFIMGGRGELGLANLNEAGIALASTLSNAWQTWMLAKAVRKHLGFAEAADKPARQFSFQVIGSAAGSAILGIAAYCYVSAHSDRESFYAFFAAIAFSVGPFMLAGRAYFAKFAVPEEAPETKYGRRVKSKEAKEPAQPQESEALKLEYAIYTTALASAVMGFFVWAVRDSLPPEGRTSAQIFQRALVPVLGGALVYAMASSTFISREYEELKNAMWIKFRAPHQS